MNFPPQVERWRPLVAKYFPAHLVDKALWVIMYESGGNPAAVGDGGNAIGLFQIHHAGSIPGRPSADLLSDPEANIRYAALNLGAASGNWAPWGENNLYQGRPFGALGHHPYPGDMPSVPSVAARPARQATGMVSDLYAALFGAGKAELDRQYPATFRHFGKGISIDTGRPMPPSLPSSGDSKDDKKRDKAQAYAETIEELKRQLAATRPDDYGARRTLEKEIAYYQKELEKLQKQGVTPPGRSAPPPPSSTQPAPPPVPVNPETREEYEALMRDLERALGYYSSLFRQYYPELTWNQFRLVLLGTSTSAPSMLPPGFQYLGEEPIDEKTGKPKKGYSGPGIYLVTGSGNVKKIMSDDQARSYFDLVDTYQTAFSTFDDYFSPRPPDDLQTALALAQYSPEMLAWQDAVDRQAYEKAVFEAAEALADREGLAWNAVLDSRRQQAEAIQSARYKYGSAAMYPLVYGPPVLPSREERIAKWQDIVRSAVPPPPARPPVNLPGLTRPTALPKVPGWGSRYDWLKDDPISRLGNTDELMPLLPM